MTSVLRTCVCPQDELNYYYLMEKGEDASAEDMLRWLDEEHQSDETLTFIKLLVQLLQQRELMHWVSGERHCSTQQCTCVLR
jgi:hypothetical protein